MKTISKSRFISGVQCHKKIWFDYYRKDLRPPVDPAKQRVFDIGNAVGALAQAMFPDGKDATPESFYNLSPAAEQTKIWLAEEAQTIYEATFIAEQAAAMLDILHRNNEELWAIEVKSSTKVHDYHLQDAALQYFIMSRCGVVPYRFFIMHINNQYVKNGEITSDLFTMTDITQEVVTRQQWVYDNLEKLLEVISLPEEPVVPIGGHCNSPFACDYQHHCWKHIPVNSVFELTNGRNKPWDLHDMNILKLEDIPDDYPLTFNQKLQVNGVKNGAEIFDSTSIKTFLNDWRFPLHFFDFETIMPAIPLLDGTRPYQQTPFQYSLHILNENGELMHKEFLAEPGDFTSTTMDPRKKLIEQLKSDFKDTGSIVTYNLPFERRILNELANDFPEEAGFLRSIMERLVDLLPVFRNRWCYKPAMGKSASIKSVLPALLPHISYDDLEIKEGGTASESFLNSILILETATPELRHNLLKYCELDTLAMFEIFRELKRLISESYF